MGLTRTCLILGLVVSSFCAFAQEYNFRTWSLKEGLPKSGIYSLLEDQQGYLWVGTEGGGLSRFDGQNFRTFTQRDGLGNNTVRCLMEDSRGNIWAGTDGGGLSQYSAGNISTISEGLLSARIRSLTEDSAGNIWFGTMGGGLNCLSKGVIKNYNQSDGLPSDKIRSLLFDSQNRLWIGTDGGLVLKTEGGFKCFGLKDGLYPSHILCLFEDSKGRIWFGTGRGAGFYKKGHFYVIGTTDGLCHPRVRTISEDGMGNMWFGTMDGASRYDGEDFENFREENGLSYNRIRSIVKDAQGNMWFGTYFGGLSQFRDKRFAYYPVGEETSNTIIQALSYEPQNDQIVLGTWEGLYLKGKDSEQHYDTLNGLLHQVVNCVASDGAGGIWIGYDKEGLSKLSNKRFTHWGKTESDQRIPFEHLERMCYAGAGKLWLIWRDGQIGLLNNDNYINYSQRLNIEKTQVKTAFVDRRGNTWMGTAGAGLLMLKKGGQLRTFTRANDGLADQTITALAQDPAGNIWLGGPNGALSVVKAGKVSSFPDMSQKLASGISNLMFDAEGQLWVTMDRGIAQVFINDKGEPESLHSYGEETGFRGISCLPGAVTIDGEKVLWLGTLDGLTAFNPVEAIDNATAPVVHLTGVTLQDAKELVGKYADSTSRRSNLPIGLALPYRLNDINFHFDGISLKYPEQVRFSWKIEGHQDQWSRPSREQTAAYAKLPPGDYSFLLRASNETGLWSEPISLPFQIGKPWWGAWWFYLLAVLAAGALIMGLFRLRTAGLRKQKAVLEDMVSQRTKELEAQTQSAERAREQAEYSEQVKEQFLANMSHEIRTPMNAIVGLTQLLIDAKPQQSQVEYLDIIKQSSDNLLVIINDILDISKIEAGKMTFEHIDFSLEKVLNGVYQTMKHKADEKAIEFKLSVDPRAPNWVCGDPTRLSQVLINLAGNAIKFTDKGSVEIKCSPLVVDKAKVKLRFDVVDTGIGIPYDRQDALFETFTQASSETTRQYGGTGLGLSISRQLVELQGGEIDFESEQGKGSNFYFTVFFSLGKAPETNDKAAKVGEILAANSGSGAAVSLKATGSVEADRVAGVTDEKMQTAGGGTTKRSVEGIKILLVEDNAFNQMVAVDTLKSKIKDVEINVAENGKIGVEMATAGSYDIVLMDLQMPEMDGYSATKAIRASSAVHLKKLPVMAMTASVTQTEVDRCFEAGMDDFISKPFNIDELLGKITDLINKKHNG